MLWKRDEDADLESYVAIHQGVIFGALTLVTGSIWARYRWGHWWEWHENQLVLFLVLFLFYAAYFMLRFSVPAGPRRANLSAVYALFGVALVPVSILAIRLSERFIHPVAFDTGGPNMAGSQFFTFCVSLAAMLVLAATLYHARARRRSASTCASANCERRCDDLGGEVRRSRLPRHLRRRARVRRDHRVEAAAPRARARASSRSWRARSEEERKAVPVG